MLDGGESEVTGSAAVCAADCVADLVYYAAEGERLVGLVKTRRLMAMQKQQRAIHLRRGYGGLKVGMKPPMGKGGALPPHLHKSGGKPAADLPRAHLPRRTCDLV